MPSNEVVTNMAPAAVGPYAQARRAGGTLYISGQLGLDPISGKFIGDSTAEQANQAMKNLGMILDAAGLDFSDVVKMTVFLTNMDDFEAMNQVYATYFTEIIDLPARACVEVAALPKGGKVEIEAIAYAG